MNCILKIATSAVVFLSVNARAETVTFDTMKDGKTPEGFTIALTGSGKLPVWVVKPAPDGLAGKVVVQTSSEAIDNRFPILIHNGVSTKDIDLSVKFRPISGTVDQAAGLVWRYQNANNYYIVRANALEDNVVTYKVENGVRIDLPVKGQGRTYGAKVPVIKTDWNTLAIKARGTVFSIALNGKQLYDVEDNTFPNTGKIGIWTKADSVMMFGDLTWLVVK